MIVTDGFTGNIALKLMEGVSQTMLGAVRDAAMSSTRAKLGGALLRARAARFREEIDPEAQGGAYLLGLRRLGVVPARALHADGLRAGDPARASAARARTSSGRPSARSSRRARCRRPVRAAASLRRSASLAASGMRR